MTLHPIELIHLPQALSILLQFPQRLGWIFRGQTSAKWDLLPRVGRPPFFRSAQPMLSDEPAARTNPPPDLGRFNYWRKLAAGYTQTLPENDFECLAAAQHYGLPTRLLDFTKNALCALYFATESDFNEAGAAFAYLPQMYVDVEVANIYLLDEVAALPVRPIDRRILSQDAIFAFFPEPSIPLLPRLLPERYKGKEYGEYDLVKFVIPPDGKLIIHRELADVGISRRTFFPDLDGLSRQFVMEDIYRATFASLRKEQASAIESNSTSSS